MAKCKIVWDDIITNDDLELEKEILISNGMKDCEAVRVSNKDIDEFLSQAADADAICAYLPLGLNEFKRLARCKVVAAPALGIDPYDLDAATEEGICICNAPEYCIDEVATHTIALLMDCVRRISRMDRRIRTGAWDWEERGVQHRLRGSTYGLVSFGNIPRRIVSMLNGFELNFIVYDPFVTDEVLGNCGVRRVESLEELFSQSDMISVHTPYNTFTHHMIGKEQFDHIKEGALFVVTGRGGVVDEAALKESIITGKIPAAALDVIEDETTSHSVLLNMPEVVLTPHYGYYSEESTLELRTTNVLQIIDVLRDKKLPRYLVNKQVAQKLKYKDDKYFLK